MNAVVSDWLLEARNPWVRLRTLISLCELPIDDAQVSATHERVLETLSQAQDLSWMEEKGTNPIKHLTALAETGLCREDLSVDPVVDRLMTEPFNAGCSDMMLLRALVMLGYGDDSRVTVRFAQMSEVKLPDDGWFCLNRMTKIDKVPKSCIKAASHALLLSSEMVKRGIPVPWSDDLIRYFVRRRLFYRTDDLTRLVLDGRPGWRMIDTFHPFEFMRVGIHSLLESLAVLGAGREPEFAEAWSILDAKRDEQGRIPLDGTLTKSYLPREHVGKPSKWVTLYACLADKARGMG